MATGPQPNGAPALPPGLVVEGAPGTIAAAFAALCPLQPVRIDPGGLVCAPRAAPELAAPALARCPLPVRPLERVPGWPAPAAAMVAGWYRRSPDHAPAPAGVRELVQAPGEGFGPGDHPSTAMCLEALDALSPGPAVDAGCGSGLLAQAWARLGRGPVLALDLDPRALDQAARSLAAAGLAGRVRLRLGPAEALAPGELAGAALLANLPAAAHRGLLARIGRPPRAAVLSGLRPGEAGPVADGYRALGLAPRAVARAGGFVCLTMAAP
jgi:Ribosomal protein L11 methyltransferase (PrmA)